MVALLTWNLLLDGINLNRQVESGPSLRLKKPTYIFILHYMPGHMTLASAPFWRKWNLDRPTACCIYSLYTLCSIPGCGCIGLCKLSDLFLRVTRSLAAHMQWPFACLHQDPSGAVACCSCMSHTVSILWSECWDACGMRLQASLPDYERRFQESVDRTTENWTLPIFTSQALKTTAPRVSRSMQCGLFQFHGVGSERVTWTRGWGACTDCGNPTVMTTNFILRKLF